MFLFIPRSLCALKRVASKADHPRFAATQGIRIALASGMYRAEATDGHRAIVVQGMVPIEEPPWPAFKELPDDAFEAIILPKDLERACKVGDDYLQSRFGRAMPELHVWVAIPQRGEIIDMTTRYWPEQCLLIQQRDWPGHKPPTYFWGAANELPEGVLYAPDMTAIALALHLLKGELP